MNNVGDCKFCKKSNSPERPRITVSGLGYYMGYVCDTCYRAYDAGFHVGYDDGKIDSKNKIKEQLVQLGIYEEYVKKIRTLIII